MNQSHLILSWISEVMFHKNDIFMQILKKAINGLNINKCDFNPIFLLSVLQSRKMPFN